jgi:hypothetical protein
MEKERVRERDWMCWIEYLNFNCDREKRRDVS